MIKPVAVIFLIFLLTNCSASSENHPVWESEVGKLQLESLSDTLRIPYGMAFLPDGRLLVSDRSEGKIFIINPETKENSLIENLPEVRGDSFGGMMDIALHPNYAMNGWIYFNYTIRNDKGYTLVTDRAKLEGNMMVHRERLFTALPYYEEEGHFGSSIALKDGYLFFSTGDFFALKDSAQVLTNHLGKIIRLYDNGEIPSDNPFVNVKGAQPEIWSYGHRNPQGLAFHPVTGELWGHEHGPKGGDEINIIRQGLNYGWPVISYGIDYDGSPIGEGITEKEGMEQPLYYYVPSIAPSGITFYTGNRIAEWKNNLFIGALALQHLNRLVIENGEIVHEERLFTDQGWRIRNVKQGPDGYLYMGIDNGPIMRIKDQ